MYRYRPTALNNPPFLLFQRRNRKPPLPKKKKKKKKKKRQKQKKREHPYEKRVKYRRKIREADIKRKTQIQAIAEFLKNVLPDTAFFTQLKSSLPSTPNTLRFSGTQTEEEAALPTPTIASTSKEVVYETPTHRRFPELEDDEDYDDDDNNFAEEDVQGYVRENVGTIASPYIVPYFYNKRFLDTQYGIRNVGDSFMIGDSAVLVDNDSDITIKGQEFRGTKGLWELLTRKNVNRKHITTDDLKKYKKILC